MENLISNAERRAIATGDKVVVPRICDLPHVLPAMTGKIELVFEGEQEGSAKVGKALVGKAVREIFKRYFTDPLQRKPPRPQPADKQGGPESEYVPITSWFESGNKIEISDELSIDDYFKELNKVTGLRELAMKRMRLSEHDRYELASAMEFAIDGLHQFSKIAKDEVERVTSYKDLVGSIFTGKDRGMDEY
jgi:magnesium chelatase subunit I